MLVVDYTEFIELDERLSKRRGAASKEGYKLWDRYDNAIREAMCLHGKTVGSEYGEVDFYHGDDWFHELYDGFALMTPTALSLSLLSDLQEVVAKHHADAVLSFGGEMYTNMHGLVVLVTAKEIYAAWCEKSAATCRRRLKETGVAIL